MSITSVKVCNVSNGATEQEIKEFFSFSGEVEHLEVHSENENSKTAYVSFKDAQGAETAVLLSGATIADRAVTIALAPDFKPPVTISSSSQDKAGDGSKSTSGEGAHAAEDVVSTMLAKGFILGKDALSQARAFDEKHQLVSTASAKMKEVDEKMGLREKITMGSSMVNEKMKEVDQMYQVTDKTKSALSAAEQTVSNASSALMKNRYVLTGASWAAGAYTRVAKAAEGVGQKTREKVAEEEGKGNNPASGEQEETQHQQQQQQPQQQQQQQLVAESESPKKPTEPSAGA